MFCVNGWNTEITDHYTGTAAQVIDSPIALHLYYCLNYQGIIKLPDLHFFYFTKQEKGSCFLVTSWTKGKKKPLSAQSCRLMFDGKSQRIEVNGRLLYFLRKTLDRKVVLLSNYLREIIAIHCVNSL